MAEMPNEMKNLGALIAVSKIIEVFADLVEAADKSTPEIKAFVKPYHERVEQTAEALEAIFGKDFLDNQK